MKRLKRVKPEIVPRPLRVWFVVHFVVDVAFAVPLMVLPGVFLSALGWSVVDPLAARLVAAALFGIGIESFLARAASVESFRTMLNLKIIWSTAAVAGLVASLLIGHAGQPVFGWAVAVFFLLFDLLWIYWKIRIRDL